MRRCDQFREQKIHFSRILTSGYLRSDYSGRELLAGPIEVNPLLAERSFGVTHGMTSQELREYRERLGINREHQFDARDEGAESYEDVWKRQKPLFTKVLPGMADLESVALIVHSECVKVLRMRLEGMTIATFLRENAQGNLKMGNGDMIEYSRKDPCSNEIYPEYRYLRRWPLSEETFGPWEKIAP